MKTDLSKLRILGSDPIVGSTVPNKINKMLRILEIICDAEITYTLPSLANQIQSIVDETEHD